MLGTERSINLPLSPSGVCGHLPADDERNLLRRETDIEAMPSRLLHRLHAYWLGKRGDRELPGWPDIDPAEIAPLLPNLIVVAVEHEPQRFLFRLLGTLVTEFRGNATGLYLDSVPWNMPATRISIQESYARVIATRAPLFAEIATRAIDGSARQVSGGIWPLAPREGAPIDRCLAAEDYGNFISSDLNLLSAP